MTLNYEGIRFEQGELHLEAEPGFYCVRTTNRLPNGNQQASEYRFRLEREQSVEIKMRQRSGRPHQMLVNHPLEDFQVEEEGRCVEMSSLIGRKVNLLAFLDEGQEPTEHVLNEMLEHGENISSKMEIFFVLKDEGALKNETIRRVLERIPGIRVLYGEFEEIAEPLARRMYVDPDKLPLLILAVPGLTGVYACSGYNVGSVGMLLRLAEIV